MSKGERTATTKLHLGTTPWLNWQSATDLSAQAVRAEELGYASFWLPESHFTGVTSIPDPLMLLASVSASTQSIKLATTSLLLPLRHPVLAAEQVAVLDQLSTGRVILGVGRGFRPEMLEVFGVEPKLKRQQFESCLLQMKEAWQGANLLSTNPKDEVLLAPATWQKPHPPIWVAAFGPKALEQAGGLGLPYLASPIEPLDRLRENYSRHREACAANGQAVPSAVPIMRNVFISKVSKEVKAVEALLQEQVRELAKAGLARLAPKNVSDWAFVGDRNEVADKIEQYRTELGLTHLIHARMRVEGINEDARTRSLEYLSQLV